MSWRLAFHSTKLLFSYTIPFKMTMFRDAIASGNIEKIKQLAADRPRLLQQSIDSDGNTAIGLALILGDVNVIRTLLELGSNPNLANGFDGNHPLVILSKIRAEDHEKITILADLFLNSGSDPLHELRYQADSATRIDATQTPSYHETPLLSCVRFQNETLLRKMIEHQVDINFVNPESGTTPLMLAAALGYDIICNILIDAGADLNASDHAGNTPLHLAIQGFGDKVSVIKTLIQHGADIQATNEDGFTPVMLAQDLKNDELVKLFQTEKVTIQPALSKYQDIVDKAEENMEEEILSFT